MSSQQSIIEFATHKSEPLKERRRFLVGAGLLAVSSAVTLSTACKGQSQASKQNSNQAVLMQSQTHNEHGGKSDEELIDSALECIKKGQICIDHCMEMFKKGDSSLAFCADALQEMMAFCEAFTKLVSYKSKHLKEAARLCIAICEDCEIECRKHEDHHAECKECAEACRNCIDKCKKYLS
jgi:Cys-rich four helix bundle protein (predicted Tat secretion target)